MAGTPEHLIDTLLAKIRRAPPLKEDRLDNLLDFAISVEEICATVRGSEAEHRFDGPVLRELVDLLPWHLKIDWGRHCVSRPTKTLGEFGTFMRQLKSALLHVVSSSPQPVDRRAHQAAHHVSVHTTSEMMPKNTRLAAQCICDGGCKTLVECWAYWQLEVSQRWNHVRANGHCRSCLKTHKGPCKDSKPCGRDGCMAKHHRSLHDTELSITVSGSENAGKHYELLAVRTVRSLGLPPQAVDEREIAARYQHLSTVPVKSYQWESPRLLIGIDNYRLSCPLKTVEGAPHEPVATKTRIGWVIAGVCASQIGGSKRAILGVHALPCSCHHHQQRNYQQETGGGSPNASSSVGAHRAAQAGRWFASGIGRTTARHKPSNLKPEEKEKRRIRRRRKMQAAPEQTEAEALEQEHRGPIGQKLQQPNELSISLDDAPFPVEQLAEAKLLVAPDDSAPAIWNLRKRMKRYQPVLTLPKKTWLSSSITTNPADAGQKDTRAITSREKCVGCTCSRDSAKHSSDRLPTRNFRHFSHNFEHERI
uniref:Peptidase aspartic putative domain-containing protein n=1 Tax=Anopheles atroparvus TaxID=41427 RepID=A0A182J8D7_ANOAO